MKNLTILKRTLVSCLLATGCLSIPSFAGAASSSQADIATQGNTLLHNLTTTFYGPHTPPPTDQQNDTLSQLPNLFLPLNPTKTPLPAGAQLRTLRQNLLNTQITGFDPPHSNNTTIIPDLFAQCALANIALPLGSSSARASAALKCYTTANNGVNPGPSLNSKFTALNSACAAGSPCSNVRKAYEYQLSLNYCTTPNTSEKSDSTSSTQPINIQAALQQCTPKTALQVYRAIGTWWQGQRTALGLSQAQIASIDDALKSASDTSGNPEDQAVTHLRTLKGLFDLVITAANSQYILSTLQTLRQDASTSQQTAASSDLESLLQLDRFLDQPGASHSNACFSTSADKVDLSIAPLQSISNTMAMFAKRYPAPPKIYPMIPLQAATADKSLFVVAKPDKAVEILDLSKISADSTYWHNDDAIQKAKLSAKKRATQRTLIENSQNTYRNTADTLSISRNAAFSNLLYLMNLRVPSAAFKSASCSSSGSGAASPQEWMKASGLMRQNNAWTTSMQTASVANALRQAVMLLSEMRTQMYLDNQLQQRVLATLTLLQLENTKNASAAMEGSKSTLETEISKYISGNYGSPSAATATPNTKMPPMPSLPQS